VAFFIFVSMNIKVILTFIAFEEDWDIDKIVGGRSLKDKMVKQDLIEALREDPNYILENCDFEFNIDNKSV
jgi:hypothetical protein